MSSKTQSHKCTHQLFADQAAKTPDTIALTCGNSSLTYNQLNSKANQLANKLLASNVTPDELIGICAQRSIEMIIGILGILKAGAAYVPMDPEYPPDRLKYLLEDSRVSILLATQQTESNLPQSSARIINLNSDWEKIHTESEILTEDNATPENLIYAIYTSGSTGKPKGTLLYHKGFVNLLDWYTSEFEFGAGANVLLMSSTSFDLTQKNIFAPLIQGGHLVLLDTQIFDGGIIQETIEEHNITSINCTPSAFNGIVANGNDTIFKKIKSLQQVFLGGEPILVTRFADWRNNPYCKAQVINSYGPTECTDVCAYYRLIDYKRYEKSSVPIGYPICNTTLHILGTDLRPVANGEEGELCIGGAGVGAGYLHRPDLTKKSFVHDPFSPEKNNLLYKTGDRARYLSDGSIEYLGRIDQQVKIRGFRIELGEIEAALEKDPSISEAVVIGRPDKSGENRLVAYLVPESSAKVSVSEVRSFLQNDLPDYMLPTAWVLLDEIPLTPNGKIDRNALPAPQKKRPEIAPAYSPPKSPLEKLLVEIWSDILGFNKIGRHDPFFELGGTSIQSIQFIARIGHRLHQTIPIVSFFNAPTIAQFAHLLTHNYIASVNLLFPDDLSSQKEPNTTTPLPSRYKKVEQENIGPQRDEIAIIGMSGRFPGAANIYEFWDLLHAGKEVSEDVTKQDLQAAGVDTSLLDDPSYVAKCFPLDDLEKFDADFFGYSPREAEILDPQHRLFLENAWAVLEDAGYNLKTCDSRVGIFGGVARNGYLIHNICSHRNLRDLSGEYQYMLGNEKDFPVNRAAYKLNLTGPAINIQTACSSSGVAVHIACQSLHNGDCDMAIAGGCRVFVPHHTGYLHTDGGTLSEDGHLRVFDQDASGMVRGSGGGCILLKRLPQAIKDQDTVYAVIKSSAVNNDGLNKAGFTAPGIQGQMEVITKALAMAGVEAESIQYIEAHGTGTHLGDPIEVTALTQAFAQFTNKKQFCAIGSVKTNIGHLDAGACVSGIIKTVLALNRKKIPPSLNFKQPNPAIDFKNSPFYVNTILKDWPQEKHPRRAGVSAFGLGGTNVHLILEEAPVPPPSITSPPYHIFLLSARNEAALKESAHNLCRFLQENDQTNLADVAYTLEVGRQHFQYRLSVVAHNREEIINQLSSTAASRHLQCRDDHPPIYFMFPGQGSQHINMGLDLYETEPSFKKDIDDCAEKLARHISLDLRDFLFPSNERAKSAAETLAQTHITQPALFVVEYALARLWLSRGIKPAGMIGHSIGEFAAACISGVFSLDDALATVAIRGRLMFEQPEGNMLTVRLSEEDLTPFIAGQVSFAVSNAPERSVLSGPADEIIKVKKRLQDKGIACTDLHTSHAFHSSMMDAALLPFIAHLESISLQPPQIPFISSCTGNWVSEKQAVNPKYWAQQLRQPVRFSRGIQEILKDDKSILLEVGPGNSLSVLSRQHVNKTAGRKIITSWDHAAKKHSSLQCMLTALGKLWCENTKIKQFNFNTKGTRTRISLPTYPFQRKRYWIEPAADTQKENQEVHSFVSEEPKRPPENIFSHNSGQQETQMEHQQQPSRKENIAIELRKLLTELSGIDFEPSDDTSSFLELGLDSLFLTQIIGKLKKTFNVHLKFRQLLEDYTDIRTLAGYLAQEIPADMFTPPKEPPLPKTEDKQPPQTSQQAVSQKSNITNSNLENVIAGQLQIMQQQLDMLRSGSPAINTTPLPDATSPSIKQISEKKSSYLEGGHGPKPFGAAVKISKNLQADLTPSQEAFFHSFCDQYLRKTAGSKEYTKTHRPHLADPRVVSGFSPRIKELIYPIVVNRSKGSKVWDIDGNEYIDMTNAFGANFLGHSPDFITRALQDQLQQGVEIGPQHPLAGEVAQLICKFSRQDRAIFCNTGSEAVLGAMRISRTVTGRDKIVVFTDDYHGMFDEVIVRGTPSLRTIPGASGIPAASVENILVLEYGADESLKIIKEQAEDIAAVLVEPVQSRNLDLQPREFLQQLRSITTESDIALIFDEVITGFRSHLYGAQAYFDVKADIVTYGKIVGGGMPIGVICGKSQYMDALDGGQWQYDDASVPEVGVTYFAGTFVRHPLALAAAKATLEHLKQAGPQLQETLNRRTEEFVTKLKDFLIAVEAPIKVLHFTSAFQFAFTEETLANSLFFPLLRDKGIHIFPGRTWFFTTAFDNADFNAVLQALQESITELQTTGFLSGNPMKEKEQDSSTRNSSSFSTTPPAPGARLGKCPDGTPAWFVPDPDRPGKFLQLEMNSCPS